MSQGFRATSVSADTREFLNGYENAVALDHIGPALFSRPIQAETLKTIIESIRNEGLQTPIQVRRQADINQPFDLISGQHRLAAFRELLAEALATHDDAGVRRFSRIQCLIYKETMPNDLAERQSITENLARTNATAEERREWAMRYGQLTAGGAAETEGEEKYKSAKSTKPKKSTNCTDWFPKWYEGSGVNKTTAINWWNKFTKANGITATPAKATPEQRDQFFAWHLAKIEAEREAEEAKATVEETKRKQKELDAATLTFDKQLASLRLWISEARKAGVADIQNKVIACLS